MLRNRFFILALGALCIICSVSFLSGALASAPAWVPLSNTAISVTGSVSLSSNDVTFEHGQSMPWREVDQQGSRTLYAFTGEANPLLVSNNRLCGDNRPDFAVVHEENSRMTLSVFESHSAPKLDGNTQSQYGFCASYLYMHK